MSIGKNATLTAVSLIISLSFLEIGARVILGSETEEETFWLALERHVLNSSNVVNAKDSKNYHPKLGHVLSKNTQAKFQTDEFSYEVVTNQHGLRTPEFKPKANKEVSEFLLLGDSMLYGIGVERDEMVAAHLQRMMRESTTLQSTVHMVAVPGLNTLHELLNT